MLKNMPEEPPAQDSALEQLKQAKFALELARGFAVAIPETDERERMLALIDRDLERNAASTNMAAKRVGAKRTGNGRGHRAPPRRPSGESVAVPVAGGIVWNAQEAESVPPSN